VSDLIARELNPEQVTLLNDMIQSANRSQVNGVEVVVTSISRETYIPDFAFLVQKMARMENLEAIFALALMESKIYIVARSRMEEVDVGAILATLGGGGHAYAAAATVKGQTLAQTEQQLLQILFEKVRARRLARHLMSAPAIGADASVSCEEANNLLTRYNVNALLVTAKRDGREDLLGFITRQVIEKALFHKLGEVPVREYMTTEAATVGPDANLAEIQKKIIDTKQRILPVVEAGRIVGVITRTDLLNILVGQRQAEPEASAEALRESFNPRTRNVTKFMQERLSPRILGILKGLGETASRLNCGAFVVGGFVRDLFLYRSDEDMDVVIEGDGIGFARAYARLTGARIHAHEKFGTAVIIYPDGFKIDVASARMELQVPGRSTGRGNELDQAGPLPTGFHDQHPGHPTQPGPLRSAHRLLQRPERHQGKVHPGAAQPELRGGPDPGVPRHPLRAALQLRHQPADRRSHPQRGQHGLLPGALRPPGVQRTAADPGGGNPAGRHRPVERFRPAQGRPPLARPQQTAAHPAERGQTGPLLV
ncbi:MAG: CBS domain-containing protein, partial [Syntrophobacterales bacterium]